MTTPNDSPKRARNSRWDRAILALLQCATREKAAEAAGVNPATLYRWLNKPEFQEALEESRREVLRQSIGYLPQASKTAVDKLGALMDNPNEPASARVKAGLGLIALTLKSGEQQDRRLHFANLEKSQVTLTAQRAVKEGAIQPRIITDEDLSKLPEDAVLEQMRVLRETLDWVAADTEANLAAIKDAA